MKSLSMPLNQVQTVPSLDKVLKAFNHWRMTRTKHGPIPEELWKAAVSLCTKYTVSRVAQELRLGYADLRKRVIQINPSLLSKKVKKVSRKGQLPSPGFMDISLIGNPPPNKQIPECSMEIRDRDGFSMKMHCRGEVGVDILELCRIIVDSR